MKTVSRIPQLPDPASCSSEFAYHLHDALATVGAAYIPVSGLLKNSNLLHSLHALFALDEEQKRSLAKQFAAPWQGVFIALGEEQLADNQEDYKEVLDLNLASGTYAQWIAQRQQTNGYTTISTPVSPPISPPENHILTDKDLETITESLYHLFHAFQTQANYVLAALETIYRQPPNSLVKQHGKNSTLRLLHYPPAPHLSLDTIRLGSHQDYSGITLLWQDTTGGLEISTPDQEWIEVEIPSGCIGVIATELLQRWSGETLHAAPHRVRITNTDQATTARYSIAFFCETNHDCVVYPGTLAVDTKITVENPIAVKTFLSEKYDQILANLNF